MAGCVLATLVWIGWPAAGFGEPAAPAAVKTKSGTHLYVMLGFNDMSPGLAEFGARMKKRGIPTTVGSYADWRKFAAEAQRQYETGRVKSILIVGHSLGGGAARAMAARLNEASVPVKLLLTVAATFEHKIPPNVRRVVKIVPGDGENHFSVIAAHMREITEQVLGTTGGPGVSRLR